MNISNFLEHRQINRIGITEDGGMIIVFEDKSHTYIPPEDMKDIIIKYSDLRIFLNEEE